MTETVGAWAGLRVLDRSRDLGGAFAARMLAGMGADVVRVDGEEADDPTLGMGLPLGGRTTAFAAYHLDKRRLATPDASEWAALLRGADVLIESGGVGTASFLDEVPEGCEHLVRVTVSPFGTEGPYAGWDADQFTLAALSGWMAVQGEEGRAPTDPGADLVAALIGNTVVLGISAALTARERDGWGQSVDVRGLEVAVAAQIFDTVAYSYTGRERARRANLPGEPWAVLRAADGEIAAAGSAIRAWEELWLPVFGFENMPEWVFEPDAMPDPVQVRAELEKLVATRSKRELLETCQELGHLVGEVLDVHEVLESPQHIARQFFDTVEVGDEPMRVPGPPVRFGTDGWRRAHRVPWAPDDLREILAQWDPRAAPVGPQDERPPLQGVRVVDLTGGWAGPYATELLADLGAEVAKIESTTRTDWWRTARRLFTQGEADPDWLWEMSPLFNSVNESKRGVALNLNDERGRAIIRRLIATADLVVENFTPRVMSAFGLSYDEIRAINPRAVMVSMPGFGSTGPWAAFKSTALVAEAMAGVTARSGGRGGRSQVLQMSPADPNAGLVAAWAALAALRTARRTGQGQRVELAQVEAITHHLTTELLDVQVSGLPLPKRATGSPGAALAGCWRAAGDDEWLVVVARDAAALDRLAAIVDSEPGDDVALAAFIATRSKEDAAEILQAQGVIAGPVQRASEVLADRHLVETGFFHRTLHPFAGEHDYPSAPYRLARPHQVDRTPAPTLGADTVAVLSEWIGVAESEVAELREAGVTGLEPAGTINGKMSA